MATLIVGNDSANTLSGTSGKDVIYGFDPNGTQKTATTIEATRVATGLNQPVLAGAPKGDTDTPCSDLDVGVSKTPAHVSARLKRA